LDQWPQLIQNTWKYTSWWYHMVNDWTCAIHYVHVHVSNNFHVYSSHATIWYHLCLECLLFKTQNLPPGWEKRTLLSNSLNCRVQGALRNSALHNASVQWTTDTCPWTSVARPVDSGSTVTITSALCSNSCTNAAAGDWAPASTGRDKPRLLSVSAWTRATTPHLWRHRQGGGKKVR
jgi:hypothetical protein